MQLPDIEKLKAEIEKQNEIIADLKTTLAERNLVGAQSDQALAERDEKILALTRLATSLNKEIKHLIYSNSWKITKPLRIAMRIKESGQWLLDDGYDFSGIIDDPLIFHENKNKVTNQQPISQPQAQGLDLSHATQHSNDSLAIIAHAFYEDIFDEIIDKIDKLQSLPFKLYVSTPIALFELLDKKLANSHFDYYILPVSNRGRDVLPFLKIMPEVIRARHNLLLKVHTKKSMHRDDGDTWRQDIFEKLLSEPALMANLKYLENHPDLGILGPAEHLVAMRSYMGANAERVSHLAERMGVQAHDLENLNFVAGTMFIARTKAILPLVNLALGETDFEPEAKQTDGTLAHACERLLAASAFSAGLKVNCQDDKVTQNYSYTIR